MEKNNFVKIVTSLVILLLKMIFRLCIYFVFTKKRIILSLTKIDTLNFTMYILAILTSPLKIYVIRLHNLISMNPSSQTSLNLISINIFFIIKDDSFAL